MSSVVFLIRTQDRKGLVSRITTYVYERGFNILDCQQHADVTTDDFFMRLVLDLNSQPTPIADLEEGFKTLGQELELTWSSHYTNQIARVAILVTKASHCLYDLLVRVREGELKCTVPLIIGNHEALTPVAEQFGIPFHHLPVTDETKSKQESRLASLLDEHDVSLTVLARYMQILSPEFVEPRAGHIINIHHAFLPAFQGANPYKRAYERGVKMIGATAHYVTRDLDAGPIIEQDVERVTHEDSPQEMRRIGRDIERIVLARAVKAHLDHRVIVAGRRAIVFS